MEPVGAELKAQKGTRHAKAQRVPAFLLILNLQPQNIRSRIMSAGIKLHAAHGNFIHVQIGIGHILSVPYRLCDIMAVGIYDAASAAAYGFRQCSNLIY